MSIQQQDLLQFSSSLGGKNLKAYNSFVVLMLTRTVVKLL